jgi:hypothetical protein
MPHDPGLERRRVEVEHRVVLRLLADRDHRRPAGIVAVGLADLAALGQGHPRRQPARNRAVPVPSTGVPGHGAGALSPRFWDELHGAFCGPLRRMT